MRKQKKKAQRFLSASGTCFRNHFCFASFKLIGAIRISRYRQKYCIVALVVVNLFVRPAEVPNLHNPYP